MRALIIHDPETKKWERLIGRNPGKEFAAQADNCARYYESKGYDVDRYTIQGKNALEKRLNLFSFLSRLNHRYAYDRIIFLCHGHPKALNRNMISIKMKNINSFAARLKAIAAPNCKIILYSCQTAKLADGFAAQLSDLTGCDVVGHSTSGHTTTNPNKWLFTKGDVFSILGMSQMSAWRLKKKLDETAFSPFEFVESFWER